QKSAETSRHDIRRRRSRWGNNDLGANTRSFLERRAAREAIIGWLELLSRPRSHVSISGGTLAKGGCRDFGLSKCWIAESTFGDGLRSRTARHGALSVRVCRRRTDQHCRGLLREHARAHRRNRESTRWKASTKNRASTNGTVLRSPERD